MENEVTQEQEQEQEQTQEERIQLQGLKSSSDDVKQVVYSPKNMHGRRVITTNEAEINAGNVVKVLNDALQIHARNRSEIEYLYNYTRGIQPVIWRTKKVNNDICNRIVVNHANEIVTFKTANFIGEPLQYVSRGNDPAIPGKIEKLNSLMLSENKASKDMELAYSMFIAGAGYRLVLRDKLEDVFYGELLDEAPFEIYTLDPRNTFVVRLNDVKKRVVMAVTYVYKTQSEIVYSVYTKDTLFEISGSQTSAGKIIGEHKYDFGMVPIIEYPCNMLRTGAFEIVMDSLNAINTAESNRLDGVEQFIQALLVFDGVNITKEKIEEAREMKAIVMPPAMAGQSGRQGVYYLNEQLDQGQTQTLVDALYEEVLQIVGIPSQGLANTNDSSNNGAVMLKNGWWNAEARAKETIAMWKQAETDFLKIVLKICNDANILDLKVSDIEQKFGRSSYEDKLTKVQSFTTMMGAGCPPLQAYTVSGIVADPESAAMQYEQYQEEQKAEELENYAKELAEAQKRGMSQNTENTDNAQNAQGADTSEETNNDDA